MCFRMSSTPVLTLKNVEFSYKKSHQAQFTLHIDHVFYEWGHKYAIIGPNGSGKTTLLYLLSGIILPQIGELLYEGTAIKPTTKILDMFPIVDIIIEKYRSAVEIANLYALVRGQNVHEVTNRMKEIAEQLDIKHVLKKPFSKCSSGEIKLASVIIGLSLNPKILIIDEPHQAVDPRRQDIVTQLLNEYVAAPHDKKMLIFTSHHLRSITEFSNVTIQLILDGRIVGQFSNEAVKKGLVVIQIPQNKLSSPNSYTFTEHAITVKKLADRTVFILTYESYESFKHEIEALTDKVTMVHNLEDLKEIYA